MTRLPLSCSKGISPNLDHYFLWFLHKLPFAFAAYPSSPIDEELVRAHLVCYRRMLCHTRALHFNNLELLSTSILYTLLYPFSATHLERWGHASQRPGMKAVRGQWQNPRAPVAHQVPTAAWPSIPTHFRSHPWLQNACPRLHCPPFSCRAPCRFDHTYLPRTFLMRYNLVSSASKNMSQNL